MAGFGTDATAAQVLPESVLSWSGAAMFAAAAMTSPSADMETHVQGEEGSRAAHTTPDEVLMCSGPCASATSMMVPSADTALDVHESAAAGTTRAERSSRRRRPGPAI